MPVFPLPNSPEPLPSEPSLWVDAFIGRLRAKGYALRTLRKRRGATVKFLEWLWLQAIDVSEANESHLPAFLARSPNPGKDRFRDERAAVRGFLRYLDDLAGTPRAVSSCSDSFSRALLDRFDAHLRDGRGLSRRSIQIYLPRARSFLDAWISTTAATSAAEMSAQQVRALFLEHLDGRGYASVRLQAAAIRSLLRFFFLAGETDQNLSSSVPTLRRWGKERLHAFFQPAEVERILAAPDRATPGGRRDHAILLLLARLGLRAGEVVGLDLDDIHWRAAEIAIRGKGRSIDRLPLPADVGEALALYIQRDRGTDASRRVFLRKMAPRAPLSGPGAVGHIVRAAFATTGLRSAAPRGAAHLLRYSLATQMIRQGASLPEIGQVLRHRSPATTEIYAKVDFETLRGVARPWPVSGEER